MELTASAPPASAPPASVRCATGVPDLEVAVVGAGPHGLSAATHLRRAGVQAYVFGPSMAFWKSMPEGLRLRSNLSATKMIEPSGPFSLRSYSERDGRAPAGARDAQRVPRVRLMGATCSGRGRGPAPCERAAADAGRLRARTRARRSRERTASGDRVRIAQFENAPPGFEELPAGCVSHTAHHRALETFAGKPVAVVGGGQSALECAALMRERGAAQVEVLVNRAAVVWPRGHSVKKVLGRLGDVVYAPTDVGPLWYSRLVAKPALFRCIPRRAQERITLRCMRPACSHFVRVRLDGTRVTTGVGVVAARIEGGQLRLSLSDGSAREVDHLMFGTGYRVDVARYDFLEASILGAMQGVSGYPVLARGLESSVPGLNVVGVPAAWSCGPIMRFVSGSWYAGRAVAREIAGHAAGHQLVRVGGR